MKVNDVVQFVECHKWVGCFGIVADVRNCGYIIGVPVPQEGLAYVRCDEKDIIYIGEAILTPKGEAYERRISFLFNKWWRN